jgi:hypothetical protein
MFTKETIDTVEKAMTLHSRLVTVMLKLYAVPVSSPVYVQCGEIAVTHKLVCEALAASCVRLMLGDK